MSLVLLGYEMAHGMTLLIVCFEAVALGRLDNVKMCLKCADVSGIRLSSNYSLKNNLGEIHISRPLH